MKDLMTAKDRKHSLLAKASSYQLLELAAEAMEKEIGECEEACAEFIDLGKARLRELKKLLAP